MKKHPQIDLLTLSIQVESEKDKNHPQSSLLAVLKSASEWKLRIDPFSLVLHIFLLFFTREISIPFFNMSMTHFSHHGMIQCIFNPELTWLALLICFLSPANAILMLLSFFYSAKSLRRTYFPLRLTTNDKKESREMNSSHDATLITCEWGKENCSLTWEKNGNSTKISFIRRISRWDLKCCRMLYNQLIPFDFPTRLAV